MDVKYYLYHFARLHTAKYKGKPAPHKAVLLLAVMRLVERGCITSPEVELTEELVEEFKRIWAERLPVSCPFTCDIGKPFFHMQHEPFWRLLEHEDDYSLVAEELGLYAEDKKEMPKSYAVSALREKFRCAKLDKELFDIFEDEVCRRELEKLLVSKYMAYEPPLGSRHDIITMIAALCLVA